MPQAWAQKAVAGKTEWLQAAAKATAPKKSEAKPKTDTPKPTVVKAVPEKPKAGDATKGEVLR